MASKKNSVKQKVIDERKATIQQAFKDVMGLLVDFPMAGFGNTSHRFFDDSYCYNWCGYTSYT